MIFLRKPYIKKSKNKSKLIFDLEVDGEEKSVWFEVDKEYEIYLCDDRVDPILVGVLSYAMRKGHDIKTDSYITDDILFRVQEYLIPALIKGSSNLKKIKIEGKTKKALSNVGAVGTGCSCGIDSIHAYVTKTKQKSKKFNLTHLCINNVGAFNECYGKNEMDNVRKKRIQKSKEFAREVQLPLIITDSNFQTEIPQMHHLTHTYSSAFAILCLQKLWGIYYYGSSGMGIDQFSVKDNDKKDCESYELLSLDCFSTSKLKIYSEGMCQNRLEKTEDIYQHDLLKKYLHCCTTSDKNCGTCPKCKRTILSLYALTEHLDEYSKVFDITYFNDHKEEYFEWLCIEKEFEVKITAPIYDRCMQKKEFRIYVEKRNQKKEKAQEAEEYNYYKEECNKILNSTTYKTGKIVVWLPYKIKSFIHK